MAIRIDVITTIPDARAALKTKAFQEIAPKVRSVVIADSYLIDSNLSKTGLEEARSALVNPAVEEGIIGRFLPKAFDFAVEIGYLPGVTDNVGTTAQETIEDATGKKFKEGEHVYSSQVFFISGKISESDAHKIAASLHNPLIQRASVMTAAQVKREKNKPVSVPKVALHGSSKVLEVDLDVSDAELEEIGKRGIRTPEGTFRGPLALELDFMHAIQAHFRKLGRKPTDIELEALAQTWSEHCKHTIFANPLDEIENGIYKAYIKRATEEIRKKKGKNDFCVSVFKDNSGGIVFDDEYVVTHKVETHNTPSALDPFGGAITGIVGVNRDALGFGLGAKPVANVYGFCFAPAEDTRRVFRDANLTQEMLSSRRIAEGVIKGINAGGNQSGIPTPHGFMYFDESYRGKPLVFAGTVGLIPKKSKGRKLYEKKAEAGDYIVMAGGRVGLDGIHGATFSSESIDQGSPATAVQIGDPITQKKLSDAIAKEARDMALFSSITDMGAGGLSGSVGEMSRESGGAKVDLEKVPVKYAGLEPWQIWISESQERMLFSVPKSKWKAFSDLMKSRGVEATVIGEFTKSGKCVVSYKGKKIMDLELEFLHDGLPKRHQKTAEPAPIPQMALSDIGPVPKDLGAMILKMLGRNNLSSQEFLSRQFDHEVQSGSVIKPIQGAGAVTGDASVFRPVLSSNRAVVLTSALYPSYSDLNAYDMAAASLDTAIRNAVAAGASMNHLAILDNFCWTDSTNPERLWQLKEAARASYDYATLYGTPFISGKDSMFNDFKGYDEAGNPIQISAKPTLLISAIGVMKDATKAVSIDAKIAGDLVYIIGETHAELGGSEYARMAEEEWEGAPKVDGAKNLKAYKALEKAIQAEIIASAVSVGKGGIAVAIMKSAMAGKIGMSADLSKITKKLGRADFALFSESQGRILVTVAPKDKAKFEKLMKGVPIEKIGTVAKTPAISITAGGNIRISLSEALTAYRKRFKNW
jgi:phosphoribosylformylglycinamidine synthase